MHAIGKLKKVGMPVIRRRYIIATQTGFMFFCIILEAWLYLIITQFLS